jgi:hypothetical protein
VRVHIVELGCLYSLLTLPCVTVVHDEIEFT